MPAGYCRISQEVKEIEIKFSQLIEYNMRNIFSRNHSQNVVDKLVPDFFLKNVLTMDQQSEILYNLFLFYVQVETKVLTSCFCLIKSFFWGLKLVS